MRPNKASEYYYLGLLHYLEHDGEREKPVWFQFQIQDFDPPKDVYNDIRGNSNTILLSNDQNLVFEPTKEDPPYKRPKALPTRTFTASKIPDLSGREALNKELGLAGELFVLNIEKQRLLNAGLHDLANRVEHISQTQGDGAGYDIRSFKEDGGDYFIEVKTTQGGKTSTFSLVQTNLSLENIMLRIMQ